MQFDEYRKFDALGLATLIRRREVSAVEVLDCAICRTESRNPLINALVANQFEVARQEARLVDNRAVAGGQLTGVPFLIKDLTYVQGMPCRSGSQLYADVMPDHDATLVSRYRAAGLNIFGKSNTPEFGLTATTEPSLFGPTRNPWHIDYSPGGSSGGAAAAVADGWLPAAHASDGGGSIRIPASCCALVGLKPTRGRTPLGPDVGEGWGSMSTAHVVTRSVRDCAALLDLSHGPAQGDPYQAPAFTGEYLSALQQPLRQLRIAVELRSLTGVPTHGECIRAVERAGKLCADLGHVIEIVSPEFDRQELAMAAGVIVAANIANTVFGRLATLGRGLRKDEVEPYTLWFAERGRGISADEYIQALHTIHRVGRQLAAFHERYDLMLTPTLTGPPVPIGYLDTRSLTPEEYGRRFVQFWGFTNLQNATGQPAISLPLHHTESASHAQGSYPVVTGLPVGVQFVAALGQELLLLQLARQLEEAAPWFARWPSD